ncbi:MAG: PTS fructose transporter subunit IIC, partial [Nakamurella sp.]
RPSGAPGLGSRIRQYLMTGVSYMIPFVAAGGILIALGFMIGGYEIALDPAAGGITNQMIVDNFQWGDYHYWGALLFRIGAATFAFLLPVLSGYIAFAIADRPGLVPGFAGGAVAGLVGAGFLGALVTGFLGGFIALWISRWKVPKGVRGVMPVVVTPLLATLATAAVMILVLGKPLAALLTALSDWLTGLSGGSAVLLGLILGLMMCFDLGGPLNKTAYVFATTGLAAAATGAENAVQFQIMAAVMGSGMVPPLGMALATTVRSKLFTPVERENGKAAWLLGLSFISEGAIPFAAAHPLIVIPSSMVGGGVTGALIMAFGSGVRAPHGGIWVTPLISSPLLFLLALIIGTLITAALVVLLMTNKQRKLIAADERPVAVAA